MVGRECFILSILTYYVLSLPVSTSHMENQDIEAMKCIVQVIANTLNQPHPLPTSQECLNTLRTDERLISILRHRNFLKELQDIAVEGANERARQHVAGLSDHVTNTLQAPQNTHDTADESMLAALKESKEWSSMVQKRGTGEGEKEASPEKRGEQELLEGNEIDRKEQHKWEIKKADENPDNHIFNSMNQEEKAEDRGLIQKKAEKHGSSKEDDRKEDEIEEDNLTKQKNGGTASKADDTPEVKSASEDEDAEEPVEERRSFYSKKDRMEREKEEKENKQDSKSEALTKMSQTAEKQIEREEAGSVSREAGGHQMTWQEVPHHSKEVVKQEEEEEVPRSPEEQDLQMMVHSDPERREEEGSASRKTEDPEIESLAAIESELEGVAQKLHELRRG